MDYNTVIAVNDNDEVVGYMDKMEAHEKGVLHRAISVFVFNSKGEWLLQQRAVDKYHSSLLWSNTSCTHPMKEEENMAAATRRLEEEMGMQVELKKIFAFQYKAILDNGLTENELDHIFVGYSDAVPVVNPEEVASYRYVSSENLIIEIKNHPERFTEWFKTLYERVLDVI